MNLKKLPVIIYISTTHDKQNNRQWQFVCFDSDMHGSLVTKIHSEYDDLLHN